MQSKILVSVLMSVYNTREEWLKAAIESILNQTFHDFEFLIILDNPTDGSERIVKTYAAHDNRIRVHLNNQNYGLTKSLNIGLEMAKGKYIARMDADDVSLSGRLQKQFEYMEEHSDVIVLGGRCSTSDSFAPLMYEWTEDQELLKIRMLFRNAGIPHPTAFIRKSVLDEHGITYSEDIKKSQDYKLWIDLMSFGKIIMLPDILLEYRTHEDQISASREAQTNYAYAIAVQQAEDLLGSLSAKEKSFHCHATESMLEDDDVNGFAEYLNKVLRINYEKRIYHHALLERELEYIWCQKAWRRAVLDKKLDMLLHRNALAFMKPEIIKYIKHNKEIKKEYCNAIKALPID